MDRALSIHAGRIARRHFAGYFTAFMLLWLAVVAMKSADVISEAAAGKIEGWLCIVLIGVPALDRFHDFNWSSKWPLLVVLATVPAYLISFLVYVPGAMAPPMLTEHGTRVKLDVPLFVCAMWWIPFGLLALLCLCVSGTDGPNRFGKAGSSIFAFRPRTA